MDDKVPMVRKGICVWVTVLSSRHHRTQGRNKEGTKCGKSQAVQWIVTLPVQGESYKPRDRGAWYQDLWMKTIDENWAQNETSPKENGQKLGQLRESIIALITVTGGTSASKNIRGVLDAQGSRETFMLTKGKTYQLVLLSGVPRWICCRWSEDKG